MHTGSLDYDDSGSCVLSPHPQLLNVAAAAGVYMLVLENKYSEALRADYNYRQQYY